MESQINLPFNSKPSTCLHIDLNSCFATIEQQANPLLRGKPIAVAAYTAPSGCILAPSVEAKLMGIKVGMRVKEGKLLCPNLIVLPPDPWKYRSIHLKLKKLLSDYTADLTPKSIDEFVLNLEGFPAFDRGAKLVAGEIKKRIKSEIGDWLTVSIGIAPNRFLAKTAAGLHKPDGLDEINRSNFQTIYMDLALTDLCGIKTKNAARLNNYGIFTVGDFYQASIKTLMAAFASVTGHYWYLRLHGWEIDDVLFGRHSYGNSYALPRQLIKEEEITPILMKLTQKMSQRLRQAGYLAKGVHVSVLFGEGTHWHRGRKSGLTLFETSEIYRQVLKIFRDCPYKKPVSNLAVFCFDLQSADKLQLEMFAQL